MSQTVFNRYEKKYLLTMDQYEEILGRLSRSMVPDLYGKYSISNIYFDTQDDLLIRRSLTKPVYKEKLRLRSYGTPDLQTRVFLEIKKKYRRVVNKRRIVLPLEAAYAFTESGSCPLALEGAQAQIAREIAFFLERYPLERRLFLAYERTAFAGNADPTFRVTFDTHIRSRRTDLGLEKGSAGIRLLPDDLILMEVKSGPSIPVWFSEILRECRIRPVSFSKYGSAVKKEHGFPLRWITGMEAGKEEIC